MVLVERKIFESVRILRDNNRQGVEVQYEMLTNLILSHGGRVHGSQFQIVGGTDDWYYIAVYFEVPKENLDDFKSIYK